MLFNIVYKHYREYERIHIISKVIPFCFVLGYELGVMCLPGMPSILEPHPVFVIFQTWSCIYAWEDLDNSQSRKGDRHTPPHPAIG
jgi:hypothetical protein